MKEERKSINLSSIKKLEVFDKSLNEWNYSLVHKKGEVYYSGWFKKKYYEDDIYMADDFIITFTAKELIEKGNIIEDGKVYHAPRVLIHYIDGTCDAEYFGTYEEAVKYYEKLCDKFVLIEIKKVN
jgi:hypothetical protein